MLSQLCSLLRHRKFPSLYKCLCPTFNVRNGLLIRWLFINITSSLLILFSSGGKIPHGKKEGLFSFNLSICCIIEVFCSHNFQCFYSILGKSGTTRICFSYKHNATSSRYQNAVFYSTSLRYNCHNV